uniref:Uncharacterized protein n=1 Tax=Eutreptiella gymnastica TaxID=73025 RepID=A0A7S4CXT6_9EUGL
MPPLGLASPNHTLGLPQQPAVQQLQHGSASPAALVGIGSSPTVLPAGVNGFPPSVTTVNPVNGVGNQVVVSSAATLGPVVSPPLNLGGVSALSMPTVGGTGMMPAVDHHQQQQQQRQVPPPPQPTQSQNHVQQPLSSQQMQQQYAPQQQLPPQHHHQQSLPPQHMLHQPMQHQQQMHVQQQQPQQQHVQQPQKQPQFPVGIPFPVPLPNHADAVQRPSAGAVIEPPRMPQESSAASTTSSVGPSSSISSTGSPMTSPFIESLPSTDLPELFPDNKYVEDESKMIPYFNKNNKLWKP